MLVIFTFTTFHFLRCDMPVQQVIYPSVWLVLADLFAGVHTVPDHLSLCTLGKTKCHYAHPRTHPKQSDSFTAAAAASEHHFHATRVQSCLSDCFHDFNSSFLNAPVIKWDRDMKALICPAVWVWILWAPVLRPDESYITGGCVIVCTFQLWDSLGF